MHISNIKIKNFRRINNTEFNLDLKGGLTVLIGENNLGKTTIVEAISVCLSVGDISKPVRIAKEDFNNEASPIEITLTFNDLSSEQQAAFLQGLHLNANSLDHAKLVLKFEFTWRDDRPILRIYSGETQVLLQGEDFFTYLSCTYLQALRDVNTEFKVGRGNRIGSTIKSRFNLDSDDEDKNFKDIFEQANTKALNYTYQDDQGNDVKPIQDYQKDTNDNIAKLSLDNDNNTVGLRFVDTHFDHLLKGLIMKTSLDDLDIQRNGLGYNNLIYISTILADLSKASEKKAHAYHCLIVEEPEAHLHPQLQRLLLSYLKENFSNVQVILTSHSPTIASDTPLANLAIVSRGTNGIQSISVASSITNLAHQNLIQRYLDVTRSQLFFARRIIFVEGVTESMLFRAFWDYYFSSASSKFDRKGIEIVNIGGVSFEPYIDLVENIYKKTKVKVAVITDDDRGTNCDAGQKFAKSDGEIKSSTDILPIFDSAPPSARYGNLSSLVSELKTNGCAIDIFGAKKTFEVEVGLQNGQDLDLIKRLSGIEFTPEMKANSKLAGIELWKKVKDSKAIFAENILNWMIEQDRQGSFVIPEYITKAFDFLEPNDENTNQTAASSN